jgi:hypothetical protein
MRSIRVFQKQFQVVVFDEDGRFSSGDNHANGLAIK